MRHALCTISHSPLMGVNQPAEEVVAEVDEAILTARRQVQAFDPELVVIFAPDHYNGVFYDMMPPFAIGTGATSVGDWNTTAGPLKVDRDASYAVARSVLAADLDVAVSERMVVDHGFSQPIELLFGAIDAIPIVPVFINSVAMPFGPVRRVRLLGEAVGMAAAELDRRVLFMGSGGLSHDPPVPTLDGADSETAARLIGGRNPSEEVTSRRRAGVMTAARALTAGVATIAPLQPAWDALVMEILADGRLEEFDDWTPEQFAADAGNSAHEVRNWIAAFAALRTAGTYEVLTTYYRQMPEWICGFGAMTAIND